MPTGIYKRKIQEVKRLRKMIKIVGQKSQFSKGHKIRLGIKHTLKTKEKISKISKKHWRNPQYRNKLIKVHIGKKTSALQKKIAKENWLGEKNPRWNGGNSKMSDIIRKSLEGKLWIKTVLKRDNYTCIWCGKKGKYLHADHIKPFAFFPELRFAIDNGRTLCVDCHKKTDTYGGKCYKKRFAKQ